MGCMAKGVSGTLVGCKACKGVSGTLVGCKACRRGQTN